MHRWALAWWMTSLACFAEAPKIEIEPGTTSAGSTSSAATSSAATSSATTSASITETAEASTTIDGTGATNCDAGGVPVPEVPDPWKGPFFGYGLAGDILLAPDCGAGTRAAPIGTTAPGNSRCACVCDQPPEALCELTLSRCDGTGPVVPYAGGCLELGLDDARFTATPLGACTSTLQGLPQVGAATGFRCEVVVENGCTSDAPGADGLCISVDGPVDACPPGYDGAGPLELERLACEGSCDPCNLDGYCMNIVRMRPFTTADCSDAPDEVFLAPGDGSDGPVASIAGVALPEVCSAAGATELPTIVSVCCAP
jgi:hypothetical protein